MQETPAFAAPRASRLLVAAVLTAALLLTGLLHAPVAGASPISLVRAINQTTAGSNPQPAVTLAGGSTGYFLALGSGADATGSDGVDLFRTDGTAAGTSRVAALPHPAGDASAGTLTAVGQSLYFTHRTAATGEEQLWTSNGTSAAADTKAMTTWAPAGATDTHAPTIVAGTAAALYFTATEPAPAAPAGDPAPPADLHTTLYRLPAGATAATAVDAFTGSLVESATDASGGLYYETSSATGYGVWHVASTGSGAVDIAGGSPDNAPSRLGVAGDRLYFQQPGLDGRLAIWTSNTAGDVTEITFPAGAADAPLGIGAFTASGTSMYVTGNASDDPDGDTTLPVWRLDGTAPTKIQSAADAHPALGAALTAATDGAVFFAAGPDDDRTIWKATAASATPQQVTPSPVPGEAKNAAILGTDGREVFFLDGTELWGTKGTVGDATRLGAGPLSQASGSLAWFAKVGLRTIFPNATAATGLEPWSTALQADDADAITDLNDGRRDAGILHAAAMGGAMYFSATGDTRPPHELWKTDGTTGGTALVGALGIGTRDTILSVVSATAAVAVVTRNHTLWWSDGTTVRQIDVPTESGADFFAMDPEAFGESVVFTGPGLDTELGLWITDGSDDGTRRLVDLPSDPALAEGDYEPLYTAAGGQFYFLGFDALHGFELWHSNGTTGGTAMVRDLAPGAGNSVVYEIAATGDHATFVANDATGHPQVFATNAGGTTVTAITADTFTTPPSQVTASGGNVFFAVGATLWRSDGDAGHVCPTQPAAGLITSIAPVGTNVVYTDLSGALRVSASGGTLLHQFGAGGITGLAATPSGVWLAGPSGDTGTELWHTDGTTTGTALVQDLNPGNASSSPHTFVALADRLVFAATASATSGEQLMATPLGAPMAQPALALAPCPSRTTVVTPPTTPEPETPAATTPAATIDPGTSPTKQGAPPATTPATTPVAPKAKPTSLAIAVANEQDRRAPYRYVFTGRIKLPASVVAKTACSGDVDVEISRGRRVVAHARAVLKLRGGTCRYRTSVTVARKKLAMHGKLTARVSFAGNTVLTSARSRAMALKYGR